MKKLFAAAAVLALVGVAVAGAIHVRHAIRDGVCPLTGRPIAGRMHAPSIDAAASSTAATYGDVVSDSSAPSTADGSTECPKTHRHCCCPKQQQECRQATQECGQKPVEPPMQNP